MIKLKKIVTTIIAIKILQLKKWKLPNLDIIAIPVKPLNTRYLKFFLKLEDDKTGTQMFGQVAIKYFTVFLPL